MSKVSKKRKMGPLGSPLSKKNPSRNPNARYRRCDIMLNWEMLEVRQSKRLAWSPCLKFNSSQRMDMFQSQRQSSLVPINSELPIVDSMMSQDILGRSTAIKRTVANSVTLIAKHQYQMRKIYVYKLRYVDEKTGRERILYDLLDSSGTVDTNGYCSFELSDLAQLEVGVEYDITKDDFFIKYPNQFNPATDLVNMGVNARCIISADIESAGDSISASESMLRKLTALKTKTVNIHLINKVIKTDKDKYLRIFPEIGKVIEDTILFKIVNDDGIITDLSQSANVPSGVEDETVVVEPGTFIQSIEVYCNEDIQDPILEEYRQELLKFRADVYNSIAPIVANVPNQCTEYMKRYKENFSYTQFCNNTEELKHPYIKLVLTTFDVPTVGIKVSNYFGGKTTVEHIYPDGYITDEFGNNIDFVYPSTAIINRTILGLLYDHTLTGISYFLYEKIKRSEVNKQQVYEFVQKLMDILEVTEEFNYANFTQDELWEYLNEDYLRIILMPYSNNLCLKTMVVVKKLAEKYLGYRKLKIFRGFSEKLQQTNLHEVGFMYIFRDLHDTYYGNSSISSVERNTKGFALDKNSSKRDGKSLFTKKACKYDVQLLNLMVNMASNPDAHIIVNEEEETLYAIKETNEASGIELKLGDD